MGKTSKCLLVIGLLFLVYGYIARICSINFFWESKSLGWVIVIFAVIIIMIKRYKARSQQGKNKAWEVITIFILCLSLFGKMMLLFFIPNTDTYFVARDFLFKNEALNKQLGTIKGVSFELLGSQEMSITERGSSGTADLYLIVKGKKRYKDIQVRLEKRPETEWTVVYWGQ